MPPLPGRSLLALLLLLVVIGYADGSCNENDRGDGVLRYSLVPGKCREETVTTHCDDMCSAMTLAMSDKNITTLVMCDDFVLDSSNAFNCQDGVTDDTTHFLIDKTSFILQGKGKISQGTQSNIVVDGVYKRTILMITENNVTVRGIGFKRTHPVLGPDDSKNVTDITFGPQFTINGGYGDQEVDEGNRELIFNTRSITENKGEDDALLRRTEGAIQPISLGRSSIVPRDVAKKRMRTDLVMKGDHSIGKRDLNGLEKRATPSLKLKTCAINNFCGCPLTTIKIIEVFFQQPDTSGIRNAQDMFLYCGDYVDIEFSMNKHGYPFSDGLNCLNKTENIANGTAIMLGEGTGSLNKINITLNDFVVFGLSKQQSNQTFGTLLFESETKYNFWFPRPYESELTFLPKYVTWGIVEGDFSPYLVQSLGTEGILLTGPFFLDIPFVLYVDSNGNEVLAFVAFYTISAALDFGRTSLPSVNINVVSKVLVISDALVVDYPCRISSNYIEDIHGDRYPIIVINTLNPCLPAITSYYYVLSIESINIKLRRTRSGILYVDDGTTEDQLRTLIGDECNANVTIRHIKEIQDFEKVFNLNFFNTIWQNDGAGSSLPKVIITDTIFQGGRWAVATATTRYLDGMAFIHNSYVGQTAYGLLLGASKSAKVIQNDFIHSGSKDADKWSFNYGTSLPSNFTTYLPDSNTTVLSNSVSSGLVITSDSQGLTIKGNHFFRNDGYGIMLSGDGTVNILCNTFSSSMIAGVRVGCPPTHTYNYALSYCDPNDDILNAVKEALTTISNNITLGPVLNAARCVASIDMALKAVEKGYNLSVLIDNAPILSLLRNILLEMPISDFSKDNADMIIYSAFQTIVMVCEVDIRYLNTDPIILELLFRNSTTETSYRLEVLFRQRLLRNGICRDTSMEIDEPVIHNQVENGPACIQGDSLDVFFYNNLVFLNAAIDDQSNGTAVISQANTTITPSPVDGAVPLELQVDVSDIRVSTLEPLSFDRTGSDAVMSSVLFGTMESGMMSLMDLSQAQKPFQVRAESDPSVSICTDADWMVTPLAWRSFAYWQSFPEGLPCTETLGSTWTRASNVLSIDSDLKRNIHDNNHVVRWVRSESEVDQDPTLSTQSPCTGLELGVERGWNGPACPPGSCLEGFTIVDSQSSEDGCEVEFGLDQFVGRYILVQLSNVNYSLYLVDCRNGGGFLGYNIHKNPVYGSIQEAIDDAIVRRTEAPNVYDHIDISVTGRCYECIQINNTPNANIRIVSALILNDGDALLGAGPAFLIHPPFCHSNVQVYNSSYFSFWGIDFRSDLSQSLSQDQMSSTYPGEVELICGYAETGTVRDRYHRSMMVFSSDNITVSNCTFYQYENIEAIGVIYSSNFSVWYSIFHKQERGVMLYSDLWENRLNDKDKNRFNFDLLKLNNRTMVSTWLSNENRVQRNLFTLSRYGVGVGLCQYSDFYRTPDVMPHIHENDFVAEQGVALSVTGVSFLGGNFSMIMTSNNFFGPCKTEDSATELFLTDARLQEIVNSTTLYYLSESFPVGYEIAPLINAPRDLVFDGGDSPTRSVSVLLDGSYMVLENSYVSPNGEQNLIKFDCTACIVKSTNVYSGRVDIGSGNKLLEARTPISLEDCLLATGVIINVKNEGNKLIAQFNRVTMDSNLMIIRKDEPCQQSLVGLTLDSCSYSRNTALTVWDTPPSQGFPWVYVYIDPLIRMLRFCQKHMVFSEVQPGECECTDIGPQRYVKVIDPGVVAAGLVALDAPPIILPSPSFDNPSATLKESDLMLITKKEIVDYCQPTYVSQLNDSRRSCRHLKLSEFENDLPTPNVTLTPNITQTVTVTVTTTPTPTTTISPSRTVTTTPLPVDYRPSGPPPGFWIAFALFAMLIITALVLFWYYQPNMSEYVRKAQNLVSRGRSTAFGSSVPSSSSRDRDLRNRRKREDIELDRVDI